MQDSQTTPTAVVEKLPEQVRSEIDQISELLLGKEAAPPAIRDDDVAPEKDPEAVVPDAPEKEAIDYGMKVPMTGGDPVTLGELKDAYQAQAATRLDLQERENKVFQASEEARTLLSYIQDLPPHVLEAAKQDAARDFQRETAVLTDSIPELKTQAGAREVKDRLYSLAAEYGVPKHLVDGIKDATTIKMMHDYALLKQAVKNSRANIKPLRSDTAKAVRTTSTSTSETDAAIARAKQTRSQHDQITAIDKLLRA